jgi:hypothetical protein
MKMLGRSFERLETLNLFTLFQADTAAMYNSANKASFLQQIESELEKGFKTESTLHGMRVQLLFQFVVANIGHVRLIKTEDSGDCFYSGDGIVLPDYRIVTDEGESLLVEVKNHFPKKPMRAFRVKTTYLERLQRYSDTVGTPLRIAIYWAKWN